MLTEQECKKKLFQLGIKLGVSPNLISTRLLSTEDKEDMLAGLIDDDMLECHVKVWIEHGMPDFANGSSKRYDERKYIPIKTGWVKGNR